MKILVLGHHGMLGNVVYKYFNDKHDVEIIEGVRWNSDEFKMRVISSNADFIINCIGAIPQKKHTKESYELLNIELPKFLEKTGRKIIHPSTDCEFSGKLEYPKKYTKNDFRDADDDYGMSKAIASELIVNYFKNTKMIRASIIGHEETGHFSLLDWFLGADESKEVNGYANYYWNGITTLFWAKMAEKMVSNWNDYDVMVQIGVEGLHKCDLLKTVAKIYGKSTKINEFNMAVPLNKMLETDFKIPTIEEQLIELKDFYFNSYEKCVVCKKQTNVPIDLHIDLRKNYVEGVGQLCDDCAKKIHYSNE